MVRRTAAAQRRLGRRHGHPRVRTGDAYAYTAMGNGSTAFTQNGLNQQITIGGSAATWDSKGNLTSEPQSGKTYGY